MCCTSSPPQLISFDLTSITIHRQLTTYQTFHMRKEESKLEVVELHPSFGAEVRGLDFSDIPDHAFAEVLGIIAKVVKPEYLSEGDNTLNTDPCCR